jgi:hypothetical protein
MESDLNCGYLVYFVFVGTIVALSAESVEGPATAIDQKRRGTTTDEYLAQTTLEPEESPKHESCF